ncbi:MAG: universal stress protein [Thiotrichaceae bacterium]|nr:universal stress protein [Thiotrichaceae bacterium]
MAFFQNILVALDFNEAEQAEVDHALNLAKLHRSKVTFISVIPDLPKNAQMEISAMSPEERIKLAVTRRKNELISVAECITSHNIEVDTVSISGKPCDEIIRQVMRGHHDLLMISEREKSSAIKSKLIGSTARQILRKCPCPVLAVHPNHPGDYSKIMATIDVREDEEVDNQGLNRAIVSMANTIAEAEGSEMLMLNILPTENARSEHLEKITKCLQSVDVEVKKDNIHLVTGATETAITDGSKKHDIDLLVMGMLSRTGIRGFFIGNTVEKVLDDVECSILAIKPEAFVSPIKV